MHNSFFFKLSDRERVLFLEKYFKSNMNAFILQKQFTALVWANRNFFKQIPNQILILNANYASNYAAFVQTKQSIFSNKHQKLIYKNVSICHINVWSSNCRLQMRKSTNSDTETNKILTPPTIDYRNSSSDDQVSTHVRPTEKGDFLIVSIIRKKCFVLQ